MEKNEEKTNKNNNNRVMFHLLSISLYKFIYIYCQVTSNRCHLQMLTNLCRCILAPLRIDVFAYFYATQKCKNTNYENNDKKTCRFGTKMLMFRIYNRQVGVCVCVYLCACLLSVQ